MWRVTASEFFTSFVQDSYHSQIHIDCNELSVLWGALLLSHLLTVTCVSRWLLAVGSNRLLDPEWICDGQSRSHQPGLWQRLRWNLPLPGNSWSVRRWGRLLVCVSHTVCKHNTKCIFTSSKSRNVSWRCELPVHHRTIIQTKKFHLSVLARGQESSRFNLC